MSGEAAACFLRRIYARHIRAKHVRIAKLTPHDLCLALAALLALVMTGCAGSSFAPGIYVAEMPAGAPGWISDSQGAPVFSPTGGTIAWGGEDGVFLRESGNAGATMLAQRPVAGRVSWSPDGNYLAFVDRAAASLVVMHIGTRRVTLEAPIRNPDAAVPPAALPVLGGPAWSPDGSRLAFDCWDGHGDELCIIRTDGTRRRQVTEIKPSPTRVADDPSDPSPAPSNVGPAAWSPDGSRLSVAAYPEQKGATAGVFVIDLDNNAARRISTVLPTSEISWSRDGDAIIFAATSDGRSDVMEVAATGDTHRVLTGSLADGADEPALNADGSLLAASSGSAIVVLEGQKIVRTIQTPWLRDASPDWSLNGKTRTFLARPDPIAVCC
jgi:Tol biopolymer transport system component